MLARVGYQWCVGGFFIRQSGSVAEERVCPVCGSKTTMFGNAFGG